MIIKKHAFYKKFMKELIKNYNNNEEIKKYLKELIKKYDDAGKKESNFNDGYNLNRQRWL